MPPFCTTRWPKARYYHH